MRRAIVTSLAVLAWGSVGLNFASAQFGNNFGQPPVRPRPTISPYLNIGGGTGAYYGIVKPQTEGNRALLALQQNVSQLQTDATAQPPTQYQSVLTGLQTGHQASFFNTGHYYPMSPPGGATTASPAAFGSGLGGYTPPSVNFGLNQGYGYNQGGYGGSGVRPIIGVGTGLGGR